MLFKLPSWYDDWRCTDTQAELAAEEEARFEWAMSLMRTEHHKLSEDDLETLASDYLERTEEDLWSY